MAGRVLSALGSPLDAERRAALPIQIVARWVALAAAAIEINVNAGTVGFTYAALNGIVVGAALGNAALAWRLRDQRPIAIGWAVASGIYDAVAITASIALVDKFTNLNFIFYFPALVSFALVFPGRPSAAYLVLTMAAYVAIVTTHPNFDGGDRTHEKQLLSRLVTMGTATLIANMVVRIERRRRLLAVREALAAHLERQRVSQEIHDGIAQEIYMLALNLEANADIVRTQTTDSALHERMQALVRLAKQALLETRSLLFNLEPALAGEEGLAPLLRAQAAEFSAVTSIPVEVTVVGAEPSLPPAATVELYRIAQEGLANVYKHARASRVELAIRADAELLSLQLADDGCGFDAATPPARGRGLASMRDRATRLGGSLTVDSSPGCGTRLTLTLPLRSAQGGHLEQGANAWA